MNGLIREQMNILAVCWQVNKFVSINSSLPCDMEVALYSPIARLEMLVSFYKQKNQQQTTYYASLFISVLAKLLVSLGLCLYTSDKYLLLIFVVYY